MGVGIDIARQRVGVGRFELGNLSPVQDLLRQSVALLGEVVEDARAGQPLAGLGLAAAGKSQLAEQHVSDLFWAAGIERLARELLDFRLQCAGALRELAGEPRQHLAVDGDAAPFHARQHRDEWPLQGFVHAGHLLGRKPRLEQAATDAAQGRPAPPHIGRARSMWTQSKAIRDFPDPVSSLRSIIA